MSRIQKLAAVVMAVGIALTAGACAGDSTGSSPGTSAPPEGSASGAWPREITHDAGVTTLLAEPLRIVSTSPSITGTLLAVNAPVVATSAAFVTEMTDNKGFFAQWADVADERGVEVAYPNLDLDLDAVDALEPDLIIGAVSGGDTVLEQYEQLSDIAPTVLLNYANPSWQELTLAIGEITGREEEAEQVLADFNAFLAEQASALSLPPQPVTILSYLGSEGGWVLDADSQHATLLTELGFDYREVSEVEDSKSRQGLTVVSPENLSAVLTDSRTIFLLPSGGPVPLADFLADPLLGTLPAVKDKQVYSFGEQSFRLDYYSARNTVRHLVETFSG